MLANTLTPGRKKQSLRLKLKQPPKVLPPLLQGSGSLSQLEQLGTRDQSMAEEDPDLDPYGAAVHRRSMMTGESGEGISPYKALLGEKNQDAGLRSQMSRKSKAFALGGSRSAQKTRPLVVAKSYSQAKQLGDPQQYSYLKTRYFQQPGQNMQLKSQKVIDSAQVVVNSVDSSAFRNQITDLSTENNEMRNKIEKLNFDKYLLAETVNQQKIVNEQLEQQLSTLLNNQEWAASQEGAPTVDQDDIQILDKSRGGASALNVLDVADTGSKVPQIDEQSKSRTPLRAQSQLESYEKPGRRLMKNATAESAQPIQIESAPAAVSADERAQFKAEREKMMVQLQTITELAQQQTLKLMEAENKIVSQKEKYMKEISYLSDLVTMQFMKQATPAPAPKPVQDDKVEKCMKEIAYLTDLLQMKVEGSVRDIPAAPTTIPIAEKQIINDVTGFWFGTEEQPGWDRNSKPEAWSKKWFVGGPEVDKKIKAKFQSAIEGVGNKQFEHWKGDRNGALATIVLCDQFSRNCFRGSPQAFSYDQIALNTAKGILNNPNAWNEYKACEKMFILMPFLHSEDKADKEVVINGIKGIRMQAEADGDTKFVGMIDMYIKSAQDHADVIDKFGRYPTRNQVLGRQSTAAEAEYLKTAGGWGQ